MTNDRFSVTCMVCGFNLNTIIDLGMHPFADSFIPPDMENVSEPIYPLQCGLCSNCGYIQNVFITDPEERYNLYPYSYTSSNSKFARTHWDNYALELNKNYDLKNSRILEIGSNDGYLLSNLAPKSQLAIGVDSSSAMSEIANANGIRTINCVFTAESAKTIKNDIGNFDLIIANNVFNHSNSPTDFLRGCALLLNKNGKLIIEVPYWVSSLDSLKFDQIYHEHISYFTIRSLDYLAKLTNFYITKFEVIDYHGGSLRVELSNKSSSVENKQVKTQIGWESDLGVFDLNFYVDFMKKIKVKRSIFLERLHQILATENEKMIVLIGAAAKANTFINYYKLDSTMIDFITDSSESKIGKKTPLSRIPIVDDSALEDFGKVYAIITSWNISESLERKLLSINPEIEYIKL